MALIGDIVAVLKADKRQWTKALKDAEKEVGGVDDAVDRSARNLQGAADKMKSIGASASIGITAPLTLAAGAAIGFATDFQSSMNAVAGVTGATGAELETLTNKAKELGSTTSFSASQAADGMLALSQAGLTTDQTLSGIEATLQLAAAGGLELGEASAIAANSMAQFGLDANEVERISNVLAATASNATTDIQGLAQGLKFAGTTSANAGLSIEQTSAALGILANRALTGSTGGERLRAILGTLAAPSKGATAALSDLGVSLADIDVEARGLPAVLETLKQANLSTKDAIALFGVEAKDAGLALIEAGETGFDAFTDRLTGTSAAADQAKARMQGLPGAFTELRSAVEGLGIAFVSSGLGDALVGLIGFVTDVVRAISNLPEPVLNVIGVLAGMAAAIGPVVGGLGFIVAAVPSVSAGLTALTGGAAAASAATTGLSGALAIGGAALGPIAVVAAAAAAGIVLFGDDVDDAIVGLSAFGGELSDLADEKLAEFSAAVGIARIELADLGVVGAEALRDIIRNSPGLGPVVRLFELLAEKGREVTVTNAVLAKNADLLKNTTDQLAELRGESTSTAGETDKLKDATERFKAAAEAGAQRFRELTEGARGAGKAAKEAKPLFDDAFASLDKVKLSAEQVTAETDRLTLAYQGLGLEFAGVIETQGDLKASNEALSAAYEDLRFDMEDLNKEAEKKALKNLEADVDSLSSAISSMPVPQITTDFSAWSDAGVVVQGTMDGIIAKDIEGKLDQINTSSGNAKTGLEQVSTALTDFGSKIADVVTGGGTLKDAVDALGESIIRLAAENVMGKLLGQFDDLLAKIPGLEKISNFLFGGGGGGAAGAAGSAAGQAAAGVGSAAGGAASAAGQAAGAGLTGIIGAVGGVVSAVSGVISNFQLARQETTLNAIELENRQAKDLLRDQIRPALWQIETAVAFGPLVKSNEEGRDILRDLKNFLVPKIDDIFGAVAFGPGVKAAERSAELLGQIAGMLGGSGIVVASAGGTAEVVTEVGGVADAVQSIVDAVGSTNPAQEILASGASEEERLLARIEVNLRDLESIEAEIARLDATLSAPSPARGRSAGAVDRAAVQAEIDDLNDRRRSLELEIERFEDDVALLRQATSETAEAILGAAETLEEATSRPARSRSAAPTPDPPDDAGRPARSRSAGPTVDEPPTPSTPARSRSNAPPEPSPNRTPARSRSAAPPPAPVPDPTDDQAFLRQRNPLGAIAAELGSVLAGLATGGIFAPDPTDGPVETTTPELPQAATEIVDAIGDAAAQTQSVDAPTVVTAVEQGSTATTTAIEGLRTEFQTKIDALTAAVQALADRPIQVQIGDRVVEEVGASFALRGRQLAL